MFPNFSYFPLMQRNPSTPLNCLLQGLLRAVGLVSKYNYGDMDSDTLAKQIDLEWGSLLRDNICPVWVSEFGVDLGIPEEREWLQRFVPILSALDADWAYWPLNVGPKPTCGSDEAYGMLRSDWMPKPPSTDERLTLLETVGLKMKEGAVVPDNPDGNADLQKPFNRHESDSRLRSLFSKKDPLFGVKHMPDPRSMSMIFPQTMDSSFRKVVSAPFLPTMTEIDEEGDFHPQGSLSNSRGAASNRGAASAPDMSRFSPTRETDHRPKV